VKREQITSLADVVQQRAVRELARYVPAAPNAAARLADRIVAGFDAEWRRLHMDQRGRTSRQTLQQHKALGAAIRAALRAADPNAMPALAGDAIRRFAAPEPDRAGG